MLAYTVWFAKDLIEKNKRQFQIPVYQRNYDWSATHCRKLFEDIVVASKMDKKHFTGTIVYIKSRHGSRVDYDLIIDGQQRITTLHILLKAIYDKSIEKGDFSVRDEVQDYLFNRGIEDNFKLKLKPVKNDNEQYSFLMNNKYNKISVESNIWKNFNLFQKLIEKELSKGISLKELMYGIRKLEIVEIVLDADKGDDPQTIFESINSTGLDLSIADLIRNLLLMSEPDQERLYEDYWLHLEKVVTKNELANFFYHFLNFKMRENITSGNIYSRFKDYLKRGEYSNEKMLTELEYYSNFYSAFLSNSEKYSTDINKALSDLRVLDQSTIYPFLLPLFEDRDKNIIDDETLKKVLNFFVNYSIRRLITGVPSNSLRGLYKTLYNRLFKDKKNLLSYYEVIHSFFMQLNTKDRVPTDEEFKKSLIEDDLYQKRNVCKFILGTLENNNSNETIDLKSLTVEHIMPQSKQLSWKTEIGDNYDDIHIRYVHTLGNLTITGYNSELSTRSFVDKKDIIKKNSKANKLNKDILEAEYWNESSIVKRANKLADRLIEIYKFSEIKEFINFDGSKNKISYDDLNNIAKTKPHSFYFLGEKFSTSSYIDMTSSIFQNLLELDYEIMAKLAESNYKGFSNERALISFDKSLLRRATEIKDSGIFFESNLNSKYLVTFTYMVLEEYGLDSDELYFYIIQS